MKKSISFLLIASTLIISLFSCGVEPAWEDYFPTKQTQFAFDFSGTISEENLSKIEEECNRLNETYCLNVFFVIANGTQGKTLERFTTDIYDEYCTSDDGEIFVFNINPANAAEDNWMMLGFGNGMSFAGNATNREELIKKMAPSLKINKFYDSAKIFITACEEFAKKSQKFNNNWIFENILSNDGSVQKVITTENQLIGSFSNSSIRNELLYVEIRITKGGTVGLKLLQEGKFAVKNAGSAENEVYKILLKDADGKYYSLEGKIQKNDDVVVLTKSSADSLINILKSQSGTIKIVIIKKSDEAFQYRYNFRTSNFASVLSLIQ